MTRTPWLALGLLGVLGGLSAAGWAAHAAPSAKTIDVEAKEFEFMPKAMDAQASEDLTINLKNVGSAPHDIVFELESGRVERTPRAQGGGMASVMFKAPPAVGEYVFYCSVGQHRQRGMEGKLTVGGGALPLTPITDLNNPHGVTALADGTILVGEGGTGQPQPPMFVPGNGDGRVQRISLADPGERTIVVEKLTNSIDPGSGIVGANHAIEWGATDAAKVVLVAVSGGPGQARPEDSAEILKVEAGASSVLADVLEFERANNPGGEQGESGIDSNPWRLVPGPNGMIYVSDAGGNDVLKLDPGTGELSTYAVFATINDGQATPTGLAFDPDRPGVAYVAQLAFSFPPLPNGQVRRLEDKNSDGDALDADENTLLLGGLTTPTDLAFDLAKHLFVTEIAPGTLARIDDACLAGSGPCAADARKVVATNLYGTSALAFDAAGNALVAANDTLPPGRPSTNNSNRIVRIAAADLVPVTQPTATATTVTPTATPTPGGDITMTGQVTHAVTGAPIAGATVSIVVCVPHQPFQGTSGADGRYSVLLPAQYACATLTLEVRAQGYATIRQNVDVADLRANPRRDFALTPAGKPTIFLPLAIKVNNPWQRP